MCILLEDEVQATYDDYRKAACIELMSAGPDSDSPVLNRAKNVTNGRLKFELLGQCSRYQHMTYS